MNRDDAPIHDPCDADWESMGRVDRHTRWCSDCAKLVYDLSSMTERRAARVLGEPEPPCVRYHHDDAGTIAFDFVPRARLGRRRPELEAAIRLASAASLVAMLSACAAEASSQRSEAPPDSAARVDVAEGMPDPSDPVYQVQPEASEPRRVKRDTTPPEPDMTCCAGAPPPP